MPSACSRPGAPRASSPRQSRARQSPKAASERPLAEQSASPEVTGLDAPMSSAAAAGQSLPNAPPVPAAPSDNRPLENGHAGSWKPNSAHNRRPSARRLSNRSCARISATRNVAPLSVSWICDCAMPDGCTTRQQLSSSFCDLRSDAYTRVVQPGASTWPATRNPAGTPCAAVMAQIRSMAHLCLHGSPRPCRSRRSRRPPKTSPCRSAVRTWRHPWHIPAARSNMEYQWTGPLA